MKFFVHKLGCPKNDVDADYISARLIEAGHEPVADPGEAESIIVNTCGFINDAKQESIDAILELGQLKKNGRLKSLYASGCLTQRYGDELLAEIEELDGAFGLGALDPLAEAVGGATRSKKTIRQDVRQLAYLDWRSRFVAEPFPYAYVKISDGCDRLCSYCAIPQMRGRYRSRPAESILNEAEFLLGNGKKELILVSQEATLWGSDFDAGADLVGLLKRLEALEGLAWLRLLYLHPARTSDRLIDFVVNSTKAVNYFDLPFQHINTDVLRAMKRETNRKTIEKLLERLRSVAPDAILRASFMVGFPGETEAQFEELYRFVAENEFDRVGVFAFSAEEGTVAAEMSDQVAEEVKAERLDRLMTLQQEIAFEKNNSLIGNMMEVIIDTAAKDEPAVGRTYGDCPEIDQEVVVNGDGLRVGDICRVQIVATQGYDLVGTLVTE